MFTVWLSNLILDSRVGALDRSLGFLFGAARGYLLFVIGFVFFVWLVPEKSYPNWVANSKTKGWLEASGATLEAMLPENLDSSLSKILKRQKGDGRTAGRRRPRPGACGAGRAAAWPADLTVRSIWTRRRRNLREKLMVAA